MRLGALGDPHPCCSPGWVRFWGLERGIRPGVRAAEQVTFAERQAARSVALGSGCLGQEGGHPFRTPGARRPGRRLALRAPWVCSQLGSEGAPVRLSQTAMFQPALLRGPLAPWPLCGAASQGVTWTHHRGLSPAQQTHCSPTSEQCPDSAARLPLPWGARVSAAQAAPLKPLPLVPPWGRGTLPLRRILAPSAGLRDQPLGRAMGHRASGPRGVGTERSAAGLGRRAGKSGAQARAP